MNKARLTTIAIVTLLLISAISIIIHASSRMVAMGELVDSYILPDGGALVLSIDEKSNSYEYKLTYVDASHNTIESSIQSIPKNSIEPIEYVYLSVCGSYVQMFADWHNAANDEVYLMRTIWDLSFDTETCERHPRKVYLPLSLK